MNSYFYAEEEWLITKDWRRLTRKISISTLKYSILIIGAIVAILPFYWLFISSLKTPGEIIARLTWWPENPNLMNFYDALNFLRPPIYRAFMNSIIVTGSYTVLLLLGSSLTAYALAKYRFRGGRLVFWIIISTMMLPGVITLVPSVMLMFWFGWLDTYWPLIIPGAVNAYTVFLLRQYMITVPDEVLDAARLYGCSEFGLFWRIMLPLCKPALAAIGLINFVWSWNDFLWPLIIISDQNKFTMQLALMGLWDIHGTLSQLNLVSACTVYATLPLIICSIITSKHFIKGFTGLTYTKR